MQEINQRASAQSILQLSNCVWDHFCISVNMLEMETEPACPWRLWEESQGRDILLLQHLSSQARFPQKTIPKLNTNYLKKKVFILEIAWRKIFNLENISKNWTVKSRKVVLHAQGSPQWNMATKPGLAVCTSEAREGVTSADSPVYIPHLQTPQ